MFYLNELVEWQKRILEHGPTWCIAVGSLFLLIGLWPYIKDAFRYKKTFSVSKAFFILWAIGCLCMAGNAAMYFVRDVINKTDSNGSGDIYTWMPWLKHCSFAIANLIVAIVNFFAFFIKRRNVIESRKLGITEERYWETIVKYQYDDVILENTSAVAE